MDLTIDDALLLAWRAGALEPTQSLEVEEYLKVAPEAWARLLMLPEPEAPTERWRIPPPGVRGGRARFGLELQRAAVFGGRMRVGDRFRLALDNAGAERFVVVLRRLLSGSWEVVHPRPPASPTRLGELPLEGGRRMLDLVARDSGEQDWAVVLPETLPEHEAANGADWQDVLDAVARGDLPVASARLKVG